MKRIAFVGALAAATACQNVDRSVAPGLLVGETASSANVAATISAEVFYGPERFTRTGAAPDVYERTISTDGYEAPFVVHIRNGAPGGSARVSSGRVSIDGRQVLTPNHLSQIVEGHDIAVELGASARLRVELASVPGSYLEISIEGVPSKLRVCPGEPGSYETLVEALADARGGATIQFCDGTHAVAGVALGQKSLTLEAEHPLLATLDAGGGGMNLQIGAPEPSSAAMTIRGLRFVGATFSNIHIAQAPGPVRITDSEFRPHQGQPYGGPLSYSSGVSVFDSERDVTIERSRFLGGDIGVHTGNANVTILTSRFVAQTNAAIHGGSGELHAEGNAIEGCGWNWCIAAFGGSGSIRVLRNTITVDESRPVTNALQVNVGTHEIAGNAIRGRYTSSTKKVRYPIRDHAIALDGAGSVTGNRISGAGTALELIRGPGIASENIISDVGHVFTFFQSSWKAHRNDITDFRNAFRIVGESPNASATCNWWGSAYGPNAAEHIAPAFYAPWATEPIAGTTVACDPEAGLPAVVRVCSTAEGSRLHVLTVQRALNLVATGGTVNVCDGTYHVQTVAISRSVTIAAENAAQAVMDAFNGSASFNLSPEARSVTLRGLKFIRADGNSIAVGNYPGTLIVEDAEFVSTASRPYQRDRALNQDAYQRGGIGIFESPGQLIVRNSTFIGGDIGIHANNTNLLVQSSRFSGQSNAGTFSGFEANVRVENSEYSDCGRMGCAKYFSTTGGTATYVGNTFLVHDAHPVFMAIIGANPGGTVIIEENEITGIGGVGDRAEQSTYPIDGYAVQVAAASLTVNRNRVTNAWTAFNFTPASGGGSDNVVSHVYAFLAGGGAAGGSNAVLQRNDVTDYLVGVENTPIFATLDLRCNWWGSPDGPVNIGGGILPASYTPWATQAIAGRPAVQCGIE